MTQNELLNGLPAKIYSDTGTELHSGYADELKKGTKFSFYSNHPLSLPQKGAILRVDGYYGGSVSFEVVDSQPSRKRIELHVKELPEAGPAVPEEPAFKSGRAAVF